MSLSAHTDPCPSSALTISIRQLHRIMQLCSAHIVPMSSWPATHKMMCGCAGGCSTIAIPNCIGVAIAAADTPATATPSVSTTTTTTCIPDVVVAIIMAKMLLLWLVMVVVVVVVVAATTTPVDWGAGAGARRGSGGGRRGWVVCGGGGCRPNALSVSRWADHTHGPWGFVCRSLYRKRENKS